jgi:predicted SnoaL-like aldol condensation-catalyzing enzyme
MTSVSARTYETVESAPAENAQIAVNFLKAAVVGKAHEMMRRYGGPDFVHHNPFFAAGGDTIAAAMDEDARANPDKVLDIQRTIAEGSFVAVHSRLRQQSDSSEMATVHIFRIEDGQIRELWDVGQAAPPDSPNPHGMF